MTLVGAGLAIALVLSVAVTRVQASTGLLFGVSATDFGTVSGLTLLLTCVAVGVRHFGAARRQRRSGQGSEIRVTRAFVMGNW
ncbi:MAG: hypothetical protein ACM4AI_04415 [Acidobacteriota bacterium]